MSKRTYPKKKEEGENEKFEAYEKLAQILEVLTHGAALKFKEKPNPSNLKYEPPRKRKKKRVNSVYEGRF